MKSFRKGPKKYFFYLSQIWEIALLDPNFPNLSKTLGWVGS